MASIKRPSQNHWLHGLFAMAANQTANFALNDHLEFDTKMSGDLEISGGVGQAKGKITLPGGHRYLIRVTLQCQATVGNVAASYCKAYDVTNGAFLTNSWFMSAQSTNYNTNSSNKDSTEAEIYVPTTIQVEIRFGLAATNMLRIFSTTAILEVQEIPRG